MHVYMKLTTGALPLNGLHAYTVHTGTCIVDTHTLHNTHMYTPYCANPVTSPLGLIY